MGLLSSHRPRSLVSRILVYRQREGHQAHKRPARFCAFRVAQCAGGTSDRAKPSLRRGNGEIVREMDGAASRETCSVDLSDKVDRLRRRLRTIRAPAGLRCKSFNDRRVYELGAAFFPGGHGLVDRSRESATTIVLGSDWGNEESFARLLSRSTHKDEKTFLGAKSMLVPAGYCMADCFFTNAWPLLRSDDMDEVKYHAMRDHGPFTAACREFFAETLRVLQPEIVITLGIAPAWFVAPFVGASWRGSAFASSQEMESTDLDDEFRRAESGIVYAAATHWSRLANTRYRNWTTDQERGLLRQAREEAERTSRHRRSTARS